VAKLTHLYTSSRYNHCHYLFYTEAVVNKMIGLHDTRLRNPWESQTPRA
jgi:hypothetical protein